VLVITLSVRYASRLQQDAGQPSEHCAAVRGAHASKPCRIERHTELARGRGVATPLSAGFSFAPPGRWSDRPGSFV